MPGAQGAGTPSFQIVQCTGISPSPAGAVEGAFSPFTAHFPVSAWLSRTPSPQVCQGGHHSCCSQHGYHIQESEAAFGCPPMRSWMWICPQRHTVEIDLATQKPSLPIWRGG